MRPNDPFGLRSDPDFDFADHGACQHDEVDPEIFFPTPRDTVTLQKAMDVCFSCPVIDECFSWALKHPYQQGVLGGTTQQDRHEMRAATSGNA